MLAKNDLRRSIVRMGISLATQRDQKARQSSSYAMREREQQFQIQVSGKLGSLPTEMQVKIPFDTYFTTYAGAVRDSQLNFPQARISFHLDNAPAGTIPYAHVSSWIQNDSDEFVGANVTVGAYNPTVGFQSSGLASSRAWSGVMHISFQGWGWPSDPDGDLDAGGS